MLSTFSDIHSCHKSEMVTEIASRHQREVFSPHPDDPNLSVEIIYIVAYLRHMRKHEWRIKILPKFCASLNGRFAVTTKNDSSNRHEKTRKCNMGYSGYDLAKTIFADCIRYLQCCIFRAFRDSEAVSCPGGAANPKG